MACVKLGNPWLALSPRFPWPFSSASRANSVTVEEDAGDADSGGLPLQLKNIKVRNTRMFFLDLVFRLSRWKRGVLSQGARALATEITERGARLFDLLGKERDVRVERSRVRLNRVPCTLSFACDSRHSSQALRFLDAISGNLDSTAEHQYVEK